MRHFFSAAGPVLGAMLPWVFLVPSTAWAEGPGATTGPALSVAHHARADGMPADGGEALSLEVPSDGDFPHAAFGVEADLVGIFFGRYALRFEWAARRHHAVWVSPAWTEVNLARSLALEVGYHLTFLGDGLSGPYLGPSVALALAGDAKPHAWVAAGDMGYRFFFGGATLAMSIGATYTEPFTEPRAAGPWAARVVALLGYAWM